MYNSDTTSASYSGCSVSAYCNTYSNGPASSSSDNLSHTIPLTKQAEDGSYYLLNSLNISYGSNAKENCNCDTVHASASVSFTIKTDKGKTLASNVSTLNLFECPIEDADNIIISGSVYASASGWCHSHDYSFASASASINGITANYIKLSI